MLDPFQRSHTISLFLLASPGYEGLWTRYTKKAMILPLTMGTSLPRTQSPLSLDEKIAHKGSREGETSYLSPSHEPLRFVACHSRFAFASVRKSTRLMRRLGYVHCFNCDFMKDKTVTTKIARQKSVTWWIYFKCRCMMSSCGRNVHSLLEISGYSN